MQQLQMLQDSPTLTLALRLTRTLALTLTPTLPCSRTGCNRSRPSRAALARSLRGCGGSSRRAWRRYVSAAQAESWPNPTPTPNPTPNQALLRLIVAPEQAERQAERCSSSINSSSIVVVVVGASREAGRGVQ
eukprot:scaffold34984_cov60-Phaeocystis_antarctica.AAC.1